MDLIKSVSENNLPPTIDKSKPILHCPAMHINESMTNNKTDTIEMPEMTAQELRRLSHNSVGCKSIFSNRSNSSKRSFIGSIKRSFSQRTGSKRSGKSNTETARDKRRNSSVSGTSSGITEWLSHSHGHGHGQCDMESSTLQQARSTRNDVESKTRKGIIQFAVFSIIFLALILGYTLYDLYQKYFERTTQHKHQHHN